VEYLGIDWSYCRAAWCSLSDVERRNRLERAAAKAPEYGIEMLAPGQGQSIATRCGPIERASAIA
jgi:hypothetical protein